MNITAPEPPGTEQTKLERIFNRANDLNKYALSLREHLFEIRNRIYSDPEPTLTEGEVQEEFSPRQDFVGKTEQVLDALLLNLGGIEKTVHLLKEIV